MTARTPVSHSAPVLTEEQRLDEALAESFPASDPSAGTLGREPAAATTVPKTPAAKPGTPAAAARPFVSPAPGHLRTHSAEFNEAVRRHGVRAHAHDGDAFVRDPASHPGPLQDDLAEELAEEFLASATSGEDAGREARDADVPEDEGGPFIVSPGAVEFAQGIDGSNPVSAERAAFPTPTATRER